jgi:hypothetical protein
MRKMKAWQSLSLYHARFNIISYRYRPAGGVVNSVGALAPAFVPASVPLGFVGALGLGAYVLGADPFTSLPAFGEPVLMLLLPAVPGSPGFGPPVPVAPVVERVPLASEFVLGIVPLSVGRFTTRG